MDFTFSIHIFIVNLHFKLFLFITTYFALIDMQIANQTSILQFCPLEHWFWVYCHLLMSFCLPHVFSNNHLLTGQPSNTRWSPSLVNIHFFYKQDEQDMWQTCTRTLKWRIFCYRKLEGNFQFQICHFRCDWLMNHNDQSKIQWSKSYGGPWIVYMTLYCCVPWACRVVFDCLHI